MKFERLLEIVADEPVFEPGLLLAGDVDPADVRRQLSRWVEAGRLYQFRRGFYALAPPHQKVRPDPFLVANRLVPSLQGSAPEGADPGCNASILPRTSATSK